MTVPKYISKILPDRPEHVHKGQSGRVGIFAGSSSMPGAAMLATRAAFRSGAGLVYLAAPPAVLTLALGHTPEIIGIPLSENLQLNSETIFAASQRYQWDTFIIGPGLGKADTHTENLYRDLVHRLSRHDIYSVIDADALAMASRPFESNNIAILTPHEAEFSRLFGPIQNRTKSACDASKKTQQTIVLKGPETVIANSAGYSQNTTGNPGMATAGTGDVLSGMIGALWAQYPKEDRKNRAWDAAALAVWLHGKAGDLAFEKRNIGLMASDIIETLGEAFCNIQDAHIEHRND